MDPTIVSKHLVAIDGLHTICNRTLELMQTLRNTQSGASDQENSTLFAPLIKSLSLLSRRSSELYERLRHEVSRGEASVCVIDGLNKSADLCGETHRLLSILEDIKDDQPDCEGCLSSLKALAADEGHLNDLTNDVHHVADRTNVFTQIFTVARKVQAYR
jgi:hypothetical protein